jgi:hypothetical protein
MSFLLLEQHVELEIGDDPYPSPYVVTVDFASEEVLSIYRNWDEDDDEMRTKRVHFVDYHFVPGPNFYSLGFIHLLGNIQMSLTAILRSLVDAGQFANLQAGFKDKNASIAEGGPLSIGEFRDIEVVHGTSIRDIIYPLQFKEPSNVLFQMLDYLGRSGQKFADNTDQIVQDSTNYGKVGTTLALLEAGNKFFTAYHKRLHRSFAKELELIAKINYEYMPDGGYPYDIPGESRTVMAEDYDDSVDIIPVSDPNMPSQAHRITLYQGVLQMVQQSPQDGAKVNTRELYKKIFLAAGVKDVDTLLPEPEQAKPLDPVSDIRAASEGKPIRAFPGQDHQAHIQVKKMFMQDPVLAQDPTMAAVIPVIQANIREHLVLSYVESMQANAEQVGIQEAAQMVLTANQMASQQGGSDPMSKVAEAEMIKAKTQQEAQLFKEAKDTTQLNLDNKKINLEIVKEQNRHKENMEKLRKDVVLRGSDYVAKSLERLEKEESDTAKVLGKNK